jgi:hypothetical protein
MTARDRDQGRDEEARQARVVHAAALMELFKRAHGREASTAAELRAWASSNPSMLPPDPKAVLTAEQIASALSDCLRRR